MAEIHQLLVRVAYGLDSIGPYSGGVAIPCYAAYLRFLDNVVFSMAYTAIEYNEHNRRYSNQIFLNDEDQHHHVFIMNCTPRGRGGEVCYL